MFQFLLACFGFIVLALAMFIEEQYIWLILILLIFPLYIRNFYLRHQLQNSLLAHHGYSTSPVMEIAYFMGPMERNGFTEVKRISADRAEKLFSNEKLRVGVELYIAFGPHKLPFTLIGKKIEAQKFGNEITGSFPERILIAEMDDGSLKVGYGLGAIEDKRLNDFYQLAQQHGVEVLDDKRKAGTIF